jgi:predicted nucleotide-binding protein
LRQQDVPDTTLGDALRVSQAILENYAGLATSPLKIGRALEIDPKGRQLRRLCGASTAYGLTTGGAQAAEISVEPLARRIFRPNQSEDPAAARCEAFLRPRVISDFLQRYNGSPLPRVDVAHSILIEMGVPAERASSVLDLILEGARELGLLTTIKGKEYVDLEAVPQHSDISEEGVQDSREQSDEESVPAQVDDENLVNRPPASPRPNDDSRRRRVFITHGKNRGLIEPIKKLLRFGELEAIVSVERQSVSKPVPDKVLNEMRACGAGIIHVEAEESLLDNQGKEHAVINPNVLIEIGAAMAMFGRRFILLVREGVTLPSNLQGLYEVRYAGDSLDGDATIKLLEAINDIKNHPLPE